MENRRFGEFLEYRWRRLLSVALLKIRALRSLCDDRFEGWNPSEFETCSIVISGRTLSKSTPGTVPHAVTAWLGARGPFRPPFSLRRTGTPLVD